AEAALVALEPPVPAEIERLVVRRLPRQLGYAQMRAERLVEETLVLPELVAELRTAERDDRFAVLDVVLVRTEVVQLVADDRSADADPHLEPLVRRLRIARHRRRLTLPLVADQPGARVHLDEVLVLAEHEAVDLEVVRAGLRRRRDDGGRRALILGLEVLRDHAELPDRDLRERIAATRVLPVHAALEDVV